MNYPLVSEYIEAITSPQNNFEELYYLRPVLNNDGLPIMLRGDVSVVFKMKNEQTGKFYAVKCFLNEQENRADIFRMIAEELESVCSSFLIPFEYLDKELFVNRQNNDNKKYPVLLMDWVEGLTLDKYIREHLYDEYELSLLAYQFSRMAIWLMHCPFAHGDLKPDNILVCGDGSLVLVDYDDMYVPAMKGQKARQLGCNDFRHPSRTLNDLDEHLDDFPLIVILLSIKAILYQPDLLLKYGADDRLLFSEKDCLNISQCMLLKELYPSMDSYLNKLICVFNLTLEEKRIPSACLNFLKLPKPKIISNWGTQKDYWRNNDNRVDEHGVYYSEDRKVLIGPDIDWIFDEDYIIPEGTEIICSGAFKSPHFDQWRDLDPYERNWRSQQNKLKRIIIPSSVKTIGDLALPYYYEVICHSSYFSWYKGGLYTSDFSELVYYPGNYPKEIYLHPQIKKINCDYGKDDYFDGEDLYMGIKQYPTHVVHITNYSRRFLFPHNAILSVPKGERELFKLLYKSLPIVEGEVYVDPKGVIYSSDKKSLIMFPCESQLEYYEVEESCREIRNAFMRRELGITYVHDANEGWVYSDYEYNKLTHLRLHDNVAFIEDGAFAHCKNLKCLEVPKGSKRKYELLLEGASFFKEIEIIEYND